jgi:hypothetical protein
VCKGIVQSWGRGRCYCQGWQRDKKDGGKVEMCKVGITDYSVSGECRGGRSSGGKQKRRRGRKEKRKEKLGERKENGAREG